MSGTGDDFKWFGEGFDGFPKRLPEDVVEYIIFIINSKLSAIQTRERLQGFQRALATLEKKFLKEYIWQRESIRMDLVCDNRRWFLRGTTNYGDSVADEWLIVYFLRELSQEFPDAWIRIYDTDGEFLLIEAANAIPSWLTPEVAENRVWINNHHLCVIPVSDHDNPKSLAIEEALSIINDVPTKLQHLPKIEQEAFYRLKSFPSAISENQHHATLPIPRKLAYILRSNPSYIAPAVEAFYLRDPISLRLLQPEKSRTQLNFPPESFVSVSVRFTKVLYAQLLGQQWVPPGPYGEALAKLISKESGVPSVSREKAEIGIKVTAGFEMLAQHKLYADKKATREIQLLLEDIEAGDEALPSDDEIARWPKREDNEGWLDIDFVEFEKELAGKGAGSTTRGFGDKNAQDNLRKMVERFNKFIEDEDAGLDGAKGLGLDPMDIDNDSEAPPVGWEDPEDSDDSDDNEDDDEQADKEFEEYERTFEKFLTLSSAEKSALLDDARELAQVEEAEKEEDEEIKKLSEMMEAELFSHGALNLGAKKNSGVKPVMGDGEGRGKAKLEEFLEEVDDNDVEYLDEDYNLAENMLQAFKGQAGMAGPAGNLMSMMGICFPPDADTDEEFKNKNKDPVNNK
ncbi:SGT1-domain-containing protein [Lojkania enalia]|uniref:SGT1-domain-containing protein n=1 Tax=Lojkania enalia TaxID=147567 RepID=A0A9P4N5Y8_9PLEO|nr:SGT1-domain-containing protein [Didymosphaeria enalia]